MMRKIRLLVMQNLAIFLEGMIARVCIFFIADIPCIVVTNLTLIDGTALILTMEYEVWKRFICVEMS